MKKNYDCPQCGQDMRDTVDSKEYCDSKEYWQAEAKSWQTAAETWKAVHLELIRAINRPQIKKKIKRKKK